MKSKAPSLLADDIAPSQHVMAPMVQHVLVPLAWVALGIAIDRFILRSRKPAA